MTVFEKAFAATLRHEGGYSFNPGDPGGETWRGVARRRWPEWAGWSLIDRHKRNPEFPSQLDEDVELERLVKEFYLVNFWQAIKCDSLPEPIAAKLFDVAVNVGTAAAVRLLQVALRMAGETVALDGKITPEVRDAAIRAQLAGLLETIRAAQAGYYVRLTRENPKLEQFINGWINRAKA